MNAVTCLTWVHRGVAKSRPDTVQLTDEELQKMIESSAGTKPSEDDNEEESDTENDSRKDTESGKPEPGMDSVESRYHLDEYDDDDDEDDDDGALSMAALSFYPNNRQDPYLVKDEADSDEDDMLISPNDNLIVIGKVHGDYFSLEVWVNNAADGSLYCHHDAILSTCPLVVEWVGYDPGEQNAEVANLVAVGSMMPDIELWDLDVVNTLEPAFVLKGERPPKKKKAAARAAKKVKHSPGHTDAVLGLSWNRNRRQILASASADESVGIWDLSQGSVVSFFRQHGDKVQTVQWHPVEDQLLLSGSYDGCVRLFDCRSPLADASRKWSLGGEVEKVLWNHHNPFFLFAGTDSGLLACLDVRASTPVYTHSAHTAALTTLALSQTVASCLVTASDDRLLKVWDIGSLSAVPLLVSERQCKIGAIHSGAACPDEPLLFCVGGDREMKVINLKRDPKVAEHFVGSEMPIAAAESQASDNTKPSSLDAASAMSSSVSHSSASQTAPLEHSNNQPFNKLIKSHNQPPYPQKNYSKFKPINLLAFQPIEV
jgi:periodic tryptophan protein 1